MTTHAFHLDNLRVVRSGQEVLHSVSFSIGTGQLVGLLGPSGSGKSTLLRAMLGVQRITGGSATALGHRVGAPPLRRLIGYMAQSSAIYPDLTVLENLQYFAGILDVPRADTDRVLTIVNLVDFKHRVVESLSGGEKARVSLAVSLLGSPPLLLLDEPTVGLDPLLRRDLWATFQDLVDAGTTVLVSSHVMDEAARCERLLLLRAGDLLFDDTPAALLAVTGAPTYDEAFIRVIERSVV